MRLEMCARQVALSGFSKSLPLALPSVACAEPVGEGWAQEIGTEPPGARVRGLQDGRNHLFQRKPSVSFPRKVQRWGLLLFLGVQLLPAGAFLYWNHHRHGCASFLCFLIQDKPEEGEGLLFLVQVSSVEIPHQDGYSNLSQIHPVDIGEEGLPSCPIISPYISKLAGASYAPSRTSGFGELAGIPEE